MKRSRVVLFALCLVLTCMTITAYTVTAQAAAIKVYIDSKEVAFPDANPYISNSRTLVPVRFISESLGATVYWTESTKTVTITKGSDTINLKIGSKTISKNSVLQDMDVAPAITGGRTFVPLRFVSENLGVGVEWSQKDYAVYITTTEELGNVVVTPPTADELDKEIQEMAKVNSSVGNLYNADSDHTRNFIGGLEDIDQNLGTSSEVNTVYGGDNAAVIVGLNRSTSEHYLTIRQANRTKLSFDATWVALDYMFSTEDATKVWYSIIDYLEDFNNDPNIEPLTGSITGYTYTIDIYLPNGFYVYLDPK